jgi:hypothetical protein
MHAFVPQRVVCGVGALWYAELFGWGEASSAGAASRRRRRQACIYNSKNLQGKLLLRRSRALLGRRRHAPPITAATEGAWRRRGRWHSFATTGCEEWRRPKLRRREGACCCRLCRAAKAQRKPALLLGGK